MLTREELQRNNSPYWKTLVLIKLRKASAQTIIALKPGRAIIVFVPRSTDLSRKLEGDRYLMISATAIPNSITDWSGYRPRREPANASDL